MANPDEAPSSNRRETKRNLRRELFAKLRAIPEGVKSAASDQIREFIANRPEFQSAGTVAAYVSLASEPDLDQLIRDNLEVRRWCLPRVTDEGSIEMREVTGFEDLITGGFNIQEPDPAMCPLVSGGDIDLILLPGVGFDPANRARLGRGKGHYDRFLTGLRDSESPAEIWGICFSEQLCAIAPEVHDQPVDNVVTESGFAC